MKKISLKFLVTKVVVNTFPVCNTAYVNHCPSYRSEGGANVPPIKESSLSTCLWFSEIVSLAQGLCHEAYVLTDRNIAYLGSCEEVDSWLPLLLSGNFLLPAPSEGDKRGISDLVKEFLNLPASHLSPKRSTAIPCVWVNVCINIRICVYVCKYMCLYIHIHHLFIHAVIHSLNWLHIYYVLLFNC